MYIASNDIKKYMPHPGWKIYVFQNTLMTSHECGATLREKRVTQSPIWEINFSYLNKIESSSPKDAWCPVWLKFAQWFWRRRFLNAVDVFSLSCYYLTSEKDVTLYLNKLEFPLPKDVLCQVWLKLIQWFWRRRWKCEKFTTMTTTTRNANGQIPIKKNLTWAFDLNEHNFWPIIFVQIRTF